MLCYVYTMLYEKCRYVYPPRYLQVIDNRHAGQIGLYTQVLRVGSIDTHCRYVYTPRYLQSVQQIQTHSVDKSIHLGTYKVCTTDTQCRYVYTPRYLHSLYNRHTEQIRLYTQVLTESVQHTVDRSIHLSTYRVCTTDKTVQICLYT